MSNLPTGTVTFLFTDIEGSTTLAQQFPGELPTLLARHHAILHESIARHNGHVFQITGDAFCAAFYTASDALNAALDAQRGLQHETWNPAPIKVRMGLHTGAAQAEAIEERAGGYAGYLTLTRVQRVMSTACGGQVLLANPTAELVRGELPVGITLRDMGEHRLKGLLNLEHLWQMVASDLQQDFPPLQSLNAIPDNLPAVGAYLHNRYHIGAELGRGGMGTVYRAEDTMLDRPVAIKVLSSSALGSEGRARLLREARAVAKLNHPNIMTVFDAGEERGAPFIVMELITGRSLREYQPASLAEAIELTRQICLALEHAHANGIIHRDLKPENVMLIGDPHPLLPSPFQGEPRERGAAHDPGVKVKLMDFGLAFTSGATRLTQRGEVIGTVTYLAPELIEGKSATPSSDLYALGVMLYELIAYQPPFTGDTLIAILSQHLYAPVVPPSTFNAQILPALDLLILRLLAKRPEDRLASAAEVREILEALRLDSSSTTDQPTLEPLSLLDRMARGKLVGREHDLNEANAVWLRATSGEGHVLLISGEPGIGKTRLVRELMAQARFGGATVLLGECYAEGGAPYAPLAQIIREALEIPALALPLAGRRLGGGALADLITLDPTLRADYPDVPLNPPLEAMAEQQRLFDSVVTFLAALTAHAPVLLIIDDAHWADSASLSLLRHLARRSKALPVLMILTYREVELDDARPFHEMLLDLNRERLETRLKLARLDKDQTRDLLAAMFREAITPEFLDGIYRETEGNPFFVEEVCKALIDAGQLTRESGRWKRPDMAEMEIPQSVRLAIQARVSKLTPTTQETLRLAAIIGREFPFDVLQAMSDLSEDALIDALEAAEHAQLLAEVKENRDVAYTFVHALIPSTLREGLSGLRRQRLHRRAAQALEKVYAQRIETFAAQIGKQYAEANDGEKAVPYLLQAGDRAREVYAYQEAIDHYQQALAFLKEQAPSGLAQAARAAMKLGQLHHTLFHFELSQQAYAEAFDLWQRAQDTPMAHPRPHAPHALRRYWNDFGSLDPTMTDDTASGELVDQLFSGLVELTSDLDIAPDLARRWEVFEDGRRYVFHLRPDARWSDGAPVTAHDFEFTWKRALNPTVPSPNAELFLGLRGARDYHEGRTPAEAVGVKAPDNVTLVVELEEPIGHFLYLLAYCAAFAIPRHVVDVYGEDWSWPEHIVTNGPFRLETWRHGEAVVLVQNTTYHGRFSGNLARIELDLLKESGESLRLYEQDQHDVDCWIGPGTFELARQRHPHEYVTAPYAGTHYEVFDTTRPPFDDARVRRALTHALDRPALVNIILRGDASPATGGLIPPGVPGHAADIGLAYDPDRARRLLAEAGYPDGRGFPVIEAWEGYSPEVQVFFNLLTTQWHAQLGIQVTWRHLEWVEYQKRLLTETPLIFAVGWTADYPDPDSLLRVAMHQSYMHWRHDHYAQLLETARRSADQVERLKFYAAADRLLVQEAPILPVTYGRHHYLLKPWVKRYPISPLKASYWKDVIIEAH
jgi:ABC-type oligopeptide transport system substrate-binding subunit/serine/threonine protein kinase/class 3 adenylate cyclase